MKKITQQLLHLIYIAPFETARLRQARTSKTNHKASSAAEFLVLSPDTLPIQYFQRFLGTQQEGWFWLTIAGSTIPSAVV